MDAAGFQVFFNTMAQVSATFSAFFAAMALWLIERFRESTIRRLRRNYVQPAISLAASSGLLAGIAIISILGIGYASDGRLNTASLCADIALIFGVAASIFVITAVWYLAREFGPMLDPVFKK